MALANRKEVAKLAGVSEATVSRVFNNVEPLRESTKQKVFQAAKQLNYQPNVLAKKFATGKSGQIGVVVPYLPKVHLLSTYYFSEILSGIGLELRKHEHDLLLLFQSPNERMDYTQLFQAQKVDGCIILGSRNVPGEREEIEKLHQRHLPYCLVNQTFDGFAYHSVDAQHYDGSSMAISSLIEKDLKRIVFLNGPSEYSNSVDRLKGYENALKLAGIALNEQWIFQGNYSQKSGFLAASRIGPIIQDIDAVFAANDRMAVGLMKGLQEQGFEVGKDYALMGYDDSDIAPLLQPQLSSVHVPLFEMGQIASQKILSIISGHVEKDTEIKLPVTLRERASTNYNRSK